MPDYQETKVDIGAESSFSKLPAPIAGDRQLVVFPGPEP